MTSPNNEPRDILKAGGVSELAVASTGVVYSQAFELPVRRSMGIEILFSSDAAVDVKVEFEQGNQLPTTEGSSDAAWAVGDEISSGITDENPHFLAVAPVVSLFGRIKLTGQGSNAASTKVTKLKMVESQNA